MWAKILLNLATLGVPAIVKLVKAGKARRRANSKTAQRKADEQLIKAALDTYDAGRKVARK
jgi:hypothetical protein